MNIRKQYQRWCKETGRTGSLLCPGSIYEFFEWLKLHNFELVEAQEEPKKE